MTEQPDPGPAPATAPGGGTGLPGWVRRRPVAALLTVALVTLVLTAAAAAVAVSALRLIPGPAAPTPSRIVAADPDYARRIAVFLVHDATDEQKAALDSVLRTLPQVESYTFETRAQAYENFKRIFASWPDLVNQTVLESLPESFRILVRQPADVCPVQARLSGEAGIEQIVAPIRSPQRC